MSPAFGLGIDFGTSNTVALMRWPDGRVRPLLFDANPLLPSAVFAPTKPGPGSTTPADDLVVGGDALHHARFDPAGLEPNPKQHIDEPSMLLGAREVPVADLIAAVLRFVFTEAKRVAGAEDFSVAIAHPAGWGTQRRAVLAEAARRAGLGAALLVPEPVAAAHAFTAVLGQQVETGKALVVYDLGAGTFDASVVVRRPAGFEAVAVDGLTDVGGLDIDATIVRWLGERYSPNDPELWTRLADAQDPDSLRHRRMLWHDARVAKEMLSRAPAVVLQMPEPLNVDAQLTRDEFEAAAKPLLERTVFTTAALIRQAGIKPEDIAGVLLVGGGSRIPLVATMLHRALNVAPTITEQPEIVVAEGCLLSLSAPPSDQSGEGAPLWPAAAAAAAPYASMAAGPTPSAASPPIAPPVSSPSPSPSPSAEPVAAAGGTETATPPPGDAAPGTDPGIMWPDQGATPVGFTTPPPAAPMSGPPMSAPPASGPPAGYGMPVSAPPVSGVPSSGVPSSGAPLSGAPVSGVPTSGAPRGRVYQTGAYPTVQPPSPPPFAQAPPFQQQPPRPAVPRYVPPPPAAAAMPVSPGPSSRVVPVYDERAIAGAAPRKGGKNWLNALLVVIALLAVAGAGTTVYFVQLGKDKPSATSQSPGTEAGAGTAASADPGRSAEQAGSIGGAGDTATTATQSRAPATTATKDLVTVPDLSGAYVDYAKQQLQDKGLKYQIKYKETWDEEQVGKVIAQDPKANRQVNRGSTVTLTIGSQPKDPSSAPPATTGGPRPTST
ncbi:Hsp70 family protein [Dactylosporangium vinaceum]|uniref:Hsp70 family protein n=1 Tax=Dactylosporangium vinaceum TaxID=53362 RepID=A0ABV5LYR8_9ACTN|nr:Hsp70 family protein [Dactylosporangium vinaceum]UAB95304.1 Hsp70 family protein [Dactylosporangium vinaceum]